MTMRVKTDVFIVGAGGAGMYAAVAASREGADVILADKSLISRGGSTIMAQMTVAAAVGHEEPDHWTHHLADTIEAGRGLCNEELSAILCEEAVDRILEMGEWKTNWARKDGRMTQVMAPGHQVKRCCYVDFLNTGPAVARALRGEVAQRDGIRRASGLAVVDVVIRDGAVTGAVGFDVESGETVIIEAPTVILAGGGLTRLYSRNSASLNMGGDAYAMALRAGAALIDMEFVQFFPIGHLAPRLVGMDPIMWDPFRYKLGGLLLNGNMEPFIEKYGEADGKTYTVKRDVASYAIIKEVEAGRGSPHGGAWLSFQHIPADELKAAFGPVIGKLAKNNIDLTKDAIEVSPIAHYHMGGIEVDAEMRTSVSGLYAAGEAVGGANGANRLSGNAIPEAFVFGERAGRFAASHQGSRAGISEAEAEAVFDEARPVMTAKKPPDGGAGGVMRDLQKIMWEEVGLIRTTAGIASALAKIRDMRANVLPSIAIEADAPFNQALQDWFDLRNGLLCAESVALSASNRKESRGAHQMEDIPETSADLEKNQVVTMAGDALTLRWQDVTRISYVLEEKKAAVL
jgi:succinate dehydrogenase/fumarate reductase flavoprotein subunit